MTLRLGSQGLDRADGRQKAGCEETKVIEETSRRVFEPTCLSSLLVCLDGSDSAPRVHRNNVVLHLLACSREEERRGVPQEEVEEPSTT